MTDHIDTSPEAVAKLLGGVTPGPWHVSDEWNVSCDGYSVVHGSVMVSDDLEGLANARFIAAARQLVPALSADRDRLAADNAALRDALRLIGDQHIPDQPAHYGGDELSWAQRHVATLRRIAIAASQPRKTDTNGG